MSNSWNLDIIINYDKWNNLSFDIEAVIKMAINEASDMLVFDLKEKEISVLLTDDKEIQKLNKEYRGKDKSTNVLSFETEDETMLGDIVVSFDTMEKEANEEDKSFHDHFTHLVLHSFLHLLGFDHIEDFEADQMEHWEIKILDKLGIKNPY